MNLLHKIAHEISICGSLKLGHRRWSWLSKLSSEHFRNWIKEQVRHKIDGWLWFFMTRIMSFVHVLSRQTLSVSIRTNDLMSTFLFFALFALHCHFDEIESPLNPHTNAFTLFFRADTLLTFFHTQLERTFFFTLMQCCFAINLIFCWYFSLLFCCCCCCLFVCSNFFETNVSVFV